MAVHDTSVRDGNVRMRQEIQKLKEEKKMLINQLVELENLRIENKKLKVLLSQQRLE
jgi:cell shape-determining protein MreC